MKIKSHYAAYSPCTSMCRELLKAHLDKELSKPLTRMVSLHLKKCFTCRTEYNSLKSLSLSLKSVRQDNPSPSLRERILMAVPAAVVVQQKPSRTRSLPNIAVLMSFAATAAVAAVLIPTFHSSYVMRAQARVHPPIEHSVSASQTVSIPSRQSKQIASSLDPFNPHYVMQGYKPGHPVTRQHDKNNKPAQSQLTPTDDISVPADSHNQNMERYLMETSNTSETQNQISQWMIESGGNLQKFSFHGKSEDLIFTVNRNALPTIKHALRDILSGIQPPVSSPKSKNTETIHHLMVYGAMTPKLKPIPENDEVYVMIRLADPSLKTTKQE